MFIFEGVEYRLSAKTIAEMDQVMSKIRDGQDQDSVIEEMGLPGETPRDRKIQFAILKYAYEKGNN